MPLPVPPGYQSLVALDREKHGALGLKNSGSFKFASKLNIIYVSAVEFFRAAHDFPIGFIRDDNNGEYVPVAVTGLMAGENLFIDSEGKWRSGAYIPAYLRRYPFFTIEINSNETANESRIAICVDEDGLTEDAETPLYDKEGNATQVWQKSEQFINDMEQARVATNFLTRTLSDLGLFEPFEAKVHQNTGEPRVIRGLHRVNEDKLNALSAKKIKELMTKGQLSRVYAHLMSLENFARLLDQHVESNH